jgi:hypothetical protein
MIPDYFSLTMDEPQAGRYVLEITVRDNNAGVEMTAARKFEVRSPELER